MQLVAARPYNSVDERAGAPAEFCGVSVRLNFELLKRLNRRLNDLHIQPSEAVRVGCVVKSIELKCILERSIAIDVERPAEADRLQPWRRREYSGGEQRQLVVVAAVQRQLYHLRVIDDGAEACGLGLKNRSRFGYLNLVAQLADDQLKIEACRLVDLKDDS